MNRPDEIQLTLAAVDRTLDRGVAAQQPALSPEQRLEAAEIEQVARLLQAAYRDPALLGGSSTTTSGSGFGLTRRWCRALSDAMYGLGRVAGVASALVLVLLLMVSWLRLEPPMVDRGAAGQPGSAVVARGPLSAVSDASPMAGAPLP